MEQNIDGSQAVMFTRNWFKVKVLIREHLKLTLVLMRRLEESMCRSPYFPATQIRLSWLESLAIKPPCPMAPAA